MSTSQATRGAYRGIYTDEYLEALSVEHRAQAWIVLKARGI